MEPNFNKNNFNNTQFYNNNIRKNNTKVNFKPKRFEDNSSYIRVRNNINNDNYSHKTSGIKESRGSKQIPDVRPALQIDINNSNRHYWNCVTKRPDGTCEKGGVDVSNVDDWLDKLDGTNILPDNYPQKKIEIFPNGIKSCKRTDELQNTMEINLPKHNLLKKPKYGTLLGFQLKGPRKLDTNTINTNTQKFFDVYNSGYQSNIVTEITNDDKKKFIKQPLPTTTPSIITTTPSITKKESYSKEVVVKGDDNRLLTYSDFKKLLKPPKPEKTDQYCDLYNSNCNINDKSYKNHNSIYDLKCGTKNFQGGILEPNRKNANISRFIKNNIIGLPQEKENSTQILFRNSGKFSNNNLINDDLSLNKLKKFSHNNFINNTNAYRSEVNNKFFEEKTDKMVRNLTYRG